MFAPASVTQESLDAQISDQCSLVLFLISAFCVCGLDLCWSLAAVTPASEEKRRGARLETKMSRHPDIWYGSASVCEKGNGGASRYIFCYDDSNWKKVLVTDSFVCSAATPPPLGWFTGIHHSRGDTPSNLTARMLPLTSVSASIIFCCFWKLWRPFAVWFVTRLDLHDGRIMEEA